MDNAEFQAWMKVTKFSEQGFVLDEVTRHNRGNLLFYKGGEDGVFIDVSKEGVVTVGNYEGACPHIGEAMFQTVFSRKVADTQDAAFRQVTEKLGVQFLLDLIR